MALIRTINATGQLEINENLSVNVNFNYSDDNPPSSVHFDFSKGEVMVNGDYDPINQKFSNYSVIGGISDDETIEEIGTVLARIKTEFKTI
jgi:hypothetical protein